LDDLAHSKARDLRDEAVAIRLALGPDEVRVGLTDDRIEHGRVGGDDLRQRSDRQLQPLARTQQAEAQDHLVALDTQR